MSWVFIQQDTFTKWFNDVLKGSGYQVQDLCKCLRDGIKVITLLEVLSGKKVGRYNKNPRVPFQKTENLEIALNFCKAEGIKLVNIGGADLGCGDLKLTLGFIWTLILHYKLKNGSNWLLEWVRSKIPEYNINNFTTDWNDGKAICALVNAIGPGLCEDHQSLDSAKGLDNVKQGMQLAYDNFDIPMVIEPKNMASKRVDDKSMMTYISYFPEAVQNKKVDYAGRCKAYGPGLVQGVKDRETNFTVETRGAADQGNLDVKVGGAAPTKVEDQGKGKYVVTYTPKAAGSIDIDVRLGGDAVPGSVFTVPVLAEISLGGEGKIRVFYSTTHGTQKARSDHQNLQRLLEIKNIHKRPDFEPWVPIDVMEVEDRNLVFEKAGTKKLPIVYVDDKYVGDYDVIEDLNETGKLDVLLQMDKHQ